jgi:uncharacterized protein (DUF983 family)
VNSRRDQGGTPPELDLGRTFTYIKRALRLRCPHCGLGRMYRRWLRQENRCSSCRLRFERGEHDYFIGAYLVNLIVAELAVVAGLLLGMFLTWPDVPWRTLKWVLLPFVVITPLITHPFSKSLWLAIDLIYRPAEPADFAERT